MFYKLNERKRQQCQLCIIQEQWSYSFFWG